MNLIPTGAGGLVALRGVTSTAQNPSGDQAVSFDVDGVQISSANILRMGVIDLQQIEVLKGPQPLFSGKNSPAGIVSLRSADPAASLSQAQLAGIGARTGTNLTGGLSDLTGINNRGCEIRLQLTLRID